MLLFLVRLQHGELAPYQEQFGYIFHYQSGNGRTCTNCHSAPARRWQNTAGVRLRLPRPFRLPSNAVQPIRV